MNQPEEPRSNSLSSSGPADGMGKFDLLPLNAENLSGALHHLSSPVVILRHGSQLFVSNQTCPPPADGNWEKVAAADPFPPEVLGDPEFKRTYGTRYALYGGSMANGIASEEMVIALGKAGFMGSFGAGGLGPDRVEKAIHQIQNALGDQPYAFNLINSPLEPAMEQRTADLYISHDLPVIEASAYLSITPALAAYRASGLSQAVDGQIQIRHHILAKVSRKEVASKFLAPASEELLRQLAAAGRITEEQAHLARLVPLADDLTVEADSGGHTDNRPLVSALPAIIRLRDALQEKYSFSSPVRVGAAGGIATPESALAAFMMGAAFVTTGSINQACQESATSEPVRHLLAQMEMTDVTMAPASDMFEMGVKVQVLKRGTMFAMRAQKLSDLYQRYESISEIPAGEREKLESTIFKASLEDIWQECVQFFGERDPQQIARAEEKPRVKMALIFRWYLGLSSRWAMTGERGREMDYQIWCGPSMGAFNDWVRGSDLELSQNRHVANVSLQVLTGAAYQFRVRQLEAQGLRIPARVQQFIPAQS